MINAKIRTMLVHKDFILSGSADAIAAFCEDLLISIGANWSTSKHHEPAVKGTYFAFGRKADAKAPDATVHLLQKSNALRIKVVNIRPDSGGQLSIEEYNHILDEFIEAATPIAHQHGLEAETVSAHTDLSRWASPTVIKALVAFSSTANRSTGHGHPMDYERWARFVILAHREGSSLDVSTLERYLVEELHWDDSMVDKLGTSYESSRKILEANDNL